jgi:hypothetical protein
LWFGSWKNTWSSYAPDWVKKDFQRFPRVQFRDGSGTERLTPLSETNRDADARAFAAFMRRVRQVDGEAHTVIMIQVENEVGVIPDARDHSPAANAAYDQPDPKDLMDYLQEHKKTLIPELRAKWQTAGFKSSGNKDWCARYDRSGNPLFIPEAAGGAQGAANVFYAIGQHNAFGFSPFGIDRAIGSGESELAQSYDVLSQLAPLILDNQTKGGVAGVLLEELTPSQKVRLGDYTLNVTRAAAGGRRPLSAPAASPQAPQAAQSPYGIFIVTKPDEYFMAGSGLTITFAPNTPGPPIAGLATVEEGRFADARWVPGRTLAGDDTGQGNNVSLRGGRGPGILRVTLYRYR